MVVTSGPLVQQTPAAFRQVAHTLAELPYKTRNNYLPVPLDVERREPGTGGSHHLVEPTVVMPDDLAV